MLHNLCKTALFLFILQFLANIPTLFVSILVSAFERHSITSEMALIVYTR